MPPRFGTLDLAKFGKSVSTIDGYKTEPLTLKGAQILELHMEIDDDPAIALLPATMHPAIPQYAVLNFVHAPNSEWGPFTVAEVRVAGRTGVRPRGFVLRRQRQRREGAILTMGFPGREGRCDIARPP
jgi:hypothetical protein